MSLELALSGQSTDLIDMNSALAKSLADVVLEIITELDDPSEPPELTSLIYRNGTVPQSYANVVHRYDCGTDQFLQVANWLLTKICRDIDDRSAQNLLRDKEGVAQYNAWIPLVSVMNNP